MPPCATAELWGLSAHVMSAPYPLAGVFGLKEAAPAPAPAPFPCPGGAGMPPPPREGWAGSGQPGWFGATEREAAMHSCPAGCAVRARPSRGMPWLCTGDVVLIWDLSPGTPTAPGGRVVSGGSLPPIPSPREGLGSHRMGLFLARSCAPGGCRCSHCARCTHTWGSCAWGWYRGNQGHPVPPTPPRRRELWSLNDPGQKMERCSREIGAMFNRRFETSRETTGETCDSGLISGTRG